MCHDLNVSGKPGSHPMNSEPKKGECSLYAKLICRKISSTKDLKKQREYFADLSSNMATVAKSLQLGNQTIYLQYCPMKKSAWLSSEKQIRNPYYGSSMLTCGEVTETL